MDTSCTVEMTKDAGNSLLAITWDDKTARIKAGNADALVGFTISNRRELGDLIRHLEAIRRHWDLNEGD